VKITWGAIVVELAIALFTLLNARWRLAAFWLCLILHALIFLSMGLFSFSAVMVAVAALIATPNVSFSARRHEPLPRKSEATKNNPPSGQTRADARDVSS
jgi:hypothetical protein